MLPTSHRKESASKPLFVKKMPFQQIHHKAKKKKKEKKKLNEAVWPREKLIHNVYT